MPSVKTAISLDELLFARVEKAAAEMEIPRSQLFALAVEEFLERRRGESLTRAINEAHAQYIATPEEVEADQRRQAFMREQARKRLENDEW